MPLVYVPPTGPLSRRVTALGGPIGQLLHRQTAPLAHLHPIDPVDHLHRPGQLSGCPRLVNQLAERAHRLGGANQVDHDGH